MSERDFFHNEGYLEDEDAASFSTDSDDISISDAETGDGNVEEEMQGLVAEGNLELEDFLDSVCFL